MWAKIITIKRTKDLNCFSLCALNLFNTQVSQFELNYWNKGTFPGQSILLRCTCNFEKKCFNKSHFLFCYIYANVQMSTNWSPVCADSAPQKSYLSCDLHSVPLESFVCLCLIWTALILHADWVGRQPLVSLCVWRSVNVCTCVWMSAFGWL